MTGYQPINKGQDAADRFARAVLLYERALAMHQEAVDVFGKIVDRWGGGPSAADQPPPELHPAGDTAEPDAAPSPDDADRLHSIPPQMLTRRQREVAALIAKGYSNADIASRLTVTTGTAANHVAAVLDRLGMSNRAQVAAWAVNAGLVPAEPRDAA